MFGGGLLHLGVVQAGLAHCGAGDRVDGDVAHLFGGQHDPAIRAVAPPERPLPAPRVTTGTWFALAQRSTVCTSSVRRGRMIASGLPAEGSRPGLAGSRR